MPGALKTTDDRVLEFATMLGRQPDDVVRDLGLLAYYRKNPIAAFNKFFQLGDGWLKHPLNDFQQGVVRRLYSGAPWIEEVLPRFHTKTLLAARIDPALRALLGLSRYQVIVSISQENYESNLEAIDTICNGESFGSLQWLANYIHGPTIATRKANIIRFGNGAIIEFRSLMGEMRGLNRADAGGRPERVVLDDIIPTDAAWSETIRKRIVDRYLSMVVPIGRKGSQVVVVGTQMHRDDLVSLIARGVIQGYQITPKQHRAAYDEQTHEVIFPERWSYDEIMELKRTQYDAVGRSHLFRREILNDPSEEDTNPFANKIVKRYDTRTVLPSELYRVVCVDHAHGAGLDYFVVAEYGMNHDGEVFVLQAKRSNSWDISRRLVETEGVLRRRLPHALAIEDTSESRTFIDVLEKHLQAANIHCNIVRPSASQRGSKNMHILAYLQGRLNDGTLLFPETEPWADWFHAEAHNFDLTSNNNRDDFLDNAATALLHLRPPVRGLKRGPMLTGDRLSDMVTKTIYKDNTAAKRRRALAGGW